MENCISGNKSDRPPVALWRHFPVDDQSPEHLASATLQFQNTFDFDLVKVTPASSFCLKDWGVTDMWNGASEGTRDYTHFVISQPDDWYSLNDLDPNTGHLGKQLECLRILVNELEPGTPVIQTVFNPLSQAKNLSGQETLLYHLRSFPDAVKHGLDVITRTTLDFINSLKIVGVSGLFFAVQHAQYGLLSNQEYEYFGKRYDLQLLDAAQEFWLNMLHIHGKNIMFDKLADYPVQIINWHDQETTPSLEEGKENYPGVVCGGLRRQETMVLGSHEDVIQESSDAMKETDGERFILGTGCVVPINAPYGNILAARKVVENF
jgi:uroporphyrinogen decarboxylase